MITFLPVLELVNRTLLLENILRAKENDVLLLEFLVPVRTCKRLDIANALVVASAFRQFARINHLHLQIKDSPQFALGRIGFIFLDQDIKADILFVRVGLLL